jgi:hypothetical protein
MEKKQNEKNNEFYKGAILSLGIIFLVFLAFFFGLKIGQKGFFDKRYPPVFYPFVKPSKEGFIPKRFHGHGLIGTVETVSKESFVIKNRWGELVTVLVDKNTQYKIDGKNGNYNDIKKGKMVMVLGEPKEEEVAVTAKIIRIF